MSAALESPRSIAASSGPSLIPYVPKFQGPSFSFPLFARDLAAFSSDRDVCATGMLPSTPAALSHLRSSLDSGQRRRVGDYLVEQEQREADEHQRRYCDYRQPPALEPDLV